MKSTQWLVAALAYVSFGSTSAYAKKTVVTMNDIGLPPANVLGALRSAAQNFLKDPYSAQFQIGNTFAGYCKQGWLKGNGIAWKGWAVNVMINGRNSYGGYTGFTPYTAFFEGDNLIRLEEGANFGVYGPKSGLLGLEGGAGVCQFVKDR